MSTGIKRLSFAILCCKGKSKNVEEKIWYSTFGNGLKGLYFTIL
jgi:hypothetical protein